MGRAKSAAEVIGFVIGLDVCEVREYRYQPTKYATIHVYAVGTGYYCATLLHQKPPEGWKWEPLLTVGKYKRRVWIAMQSPDFDLAWIRAAASSPDIC